MNRGEKKRISHKPEQYPFYQGQVGANKAGTNEAGTNKVSGDQQKRTDAGGKQSLSSRIFSGYFVPPITPLSCSISVPEQNYLRTQPPPLDYNQT